MIDARKLVFLAVLVAGALAALANDTLYHARSIDMGYKSFDLTATETKREAHTSILNVPGFHKRSAASSRWLMCVYTDLAIQRGFKFVAVVYPEPPSEDILLGFPQSEEERCAETLGKEFGSKRALPTMPVELMSAMCARDLVHEH